MSQFERHLEAAKAGDEEAFTYLFRSVQPLLLRFLRAMGGALAEDCAAETWLSAIASLDRFHGDEAAWRAWVLTIGRRRLVDARRRGGHRETLTDDPAGLSECAGGGRTVDVTAAFEEGEGTARVLMLLQQLPPEQREAVFLRYVAGLDVRRTAELLRRSPGSVRVASHRGLRRLETLLGPEPEGDEG